MRSNRTKQHTILPVLCCAGASGFPPRMSVLNKIADIEAEMARTQKNKATMGHIGLLKAKLAKLRRELLTDGSKSGGGGGGIPGFDVARTGDARIGYVGFPSVGKSSLLNKLTNTFSEVAEYEFTTLTCVPGVVRYKGAKLQMLDLPGIIEGAKDGKGRGRQVIAVARTCNLILLILDVLKPVTHKLIIERELEGYGIRMNTSPPNISVKAKERGGMAMSTTVKLTYAAVRRGGGRARGRRRTSCRVVQGLCAMVSCRSVSQGMSGFHLWLGGGGANRAPQNWGGGVRQKGSIDRHH